MDDNRLKTNLAGVELKNPVIAASGTFASGKEFAGIFDIGRLGAITVKGLSHKPWNGNPPPRVTETYAGMLNAVGLQNMGARHFIENDLPFLKERGSRVIVNLCGRSFGDYLDVARDFQAPNGAGVDLFELNISCPNIDAGGMAIGTDPALTEKLTREVKGLLGAPLFVKLSPNVTSVTEIALAAEAGGADGLSLINTLLGMKIDIAGRRPLLGNTFGGLSGPAIKPVAVRMVYQVAKATGLPIIGMGGVSTAEDAVEFIMAGATAVAVGTASFKNPLATVRVVEGLLEYMEKNDIASLDEIRGCALHENN